VRAPTNCTPKSGATRARPASSACSQSAKARGSRWKRSAAAGSLTHTVLFPTSAIPSIGASGSIAGLLGAFLILRPRAQIVTLFPLVVYWAMAEIPAVVFLPVWFGMQFFNGFLSLEAARRVQEVAGIAWWAHVGGFVFGALVAGIWRLRGQRV
jgi:membrane associated rhomboid family serine protease